MIVLNMEDLMFAFELNYFSDELIKRRHGNIVLVNVFSYKLILFCFQNLWSNKRALFRAFISY